MMDNAQAQNKEKRDGEVVAHHEVDTGGDFKEKLSSEVASIQLSTGTQQLSIDVEDQRIVSQDVEESPNSMKKIPENIVEIEDGKASIKSHQVKIMVVTPDQDVSLASASNSRKVSSIAESQQNDSQSIARTDSSIGGSRSYTHASESGADDTHLSHTESTNSPIAPTSNLSAFEGSPELSQVAKFYDSLGTKFYHSGYVYKLNALSVDGTPLFKDASTQVIADNGGYWSKWWMELIGPVLHLWRVPDELASFGYTASLPFEQMIKNELDPPIEVMDTIKRYQDAPLLINFADSIVEVFPKNFSQTYFPGNPAPPLPYNCFFSLSTTSSNLFLFASASMIQLNYWVCSIRLVMFELQRLNQLFTRRMLHQKERIDTWNQFGVKAFSSSEYRGDISFEGPLQIRLPYSIIWKQVYAVVTSKYGLEAASIAKTSSKLFSSTKKEIMKEFDPSKRGSILLYESKKAAQKGKNPLATLVDVRCIYAIWPSNCQETQVKNVSLAKIECRFQLAETPLQNTDADRTFANFAKGFQQIRQMEDIDSLLSGVDQRPEPSDLLIHASDTSSLTQWIISILSAFSIDIESQILEDEVHATINKDTELHSKWPSQLYLSLGEMGGVPMPRYSLEESKVLFCHYLFQKVMYSKNGNLQSWNQSIAQGEWERGLCDRKEMEYKLNFLFDWVEKVVSNLKDNNIAVTKPHPNVLVSAMATVMEWLGPVLKSMIGSAVVATPVSENTTSLIGTTKKVSPIKSPSEDVESTISSVSTDGYGSVSEEEMSDEGSQSDDEVSDGSEQVSSSYIDSYQSMTKSFKSQSQTPSSHETKSEESSSPGSGEEFEFYEPNSLLSKVNPSKMPLKAKGPFFGELIQRESMTAAAPHNLKREVGTGPLLGVVKDPANKPKLQSGLLGEIERREEETKQLGFRTSIQPGYRTSSFGIQHETTLAHLNTITQRMLEILQTPSLTQPEATYGLLKEEVLQMQSIISQGKRATTYSSTSNNPFAMPNITWTKSSSSNKSSSETTSLVQSQKSIESSSASTSDRSSKSSSSETESKTSSSDDDDMCEELPLGEISKRFSATQSKISKRPLSNGIAASSTVIVSPLSDNSSESNDRPISSVPQQRPISLQHLRQNNELPPKMNQILANRPSSTPIRNSVTVTTRVHIPKDNRNQIKAAPSVNINNQRGASDDSSEGSLSDESA